jgi:regulator of protease activity HflC (stomatin/prohibitin superfamily)
MGETEEEQFEGGSANGSGIIVNDRGGARAIVDVQVNYSLDPEAAEDLYVNYGTQENFVKAICAVDIRAVPRQVAGQFDTITILTAREEFVNAIWKALETKWKPYGLVIEQVNVQHVEYPDNINESYTKAQQAEIDKQTAENKKSVAEVEAQTKVVQAQGEADANKILNDSLSDKVIQQHYIDALKDIGSHDNIVVVPEGATPMVGTNK